MILECCVNAHCISLHGGIFVEVHTVDILLRIKVLHLAECEKILSVHIEFQISHADPVRDTLGNGITDLHILHSQIRRIA